VTKQEGAHGEEILAIKRIRFKDTLYVVSCGEDGVIKKWKFKKDLEYVEFILTVVVS
jgi:hypothetical protein